MAPSSPRRSSRARGTQPPTQLTNGDANSNSASSSSSHRAERNTRSHNQRSSPAKSSTPQSLSSDGLSEPARAQTSEPPPIRRSRRQHDHNEDAVAAKNEDEVEDQGAEDEGTIRCICLQQDYPGPAIDGLPEAQIDFVMCDSCKVWQHGGCVGIFDDSTNPDNYFCEECKPALHHLSKGYAGQRYSRYLPVVERPVSKSHRKSSVAKGSETKSKEKIDKNSRAELESLTKRRSTMNSRATYDEEEVLRKVLEESKSEGHPATEASVRKGKRSRDDSEDINREIKRQRTRTDSVGSSDSDSQMLDADGQSAKQIEARKAAIRGAALQKQREKEMKEKERERAEAASKRKGRADRRRADDSPEPPDSTPKPVTAPAPTTTQTPQAEAKLESQPPETPSSSAQPANGTNPALTAPGTGSKRGGRHTAKRGGRNGTARAGTRDQDTPGADNASPTRRKGASPAGGEGTGSGADSGSGGGGSTSASLNASNTGGAAAHSTSNGHTSATTTTTGGSHAKRGRHHNNNNTTSHHGPANGTSSTSSSHHHHHHHNNHNSHHSTHNPPTLSTSSSHHNHHNNHHHNNHSRDPSLLEMRKKAGAMAHYMREAEVENSRWTERGIADAVARMRAGPEGVGAVVGAVEISLLPSSASPSSSSPLAPVMVGGECKGALPPVGPGEELKRLAAELAGKLVRWEGEFGKWPDK